MKNFPGKKIESLVYWLSCRYSVGSSGIAAWLAGGAMCAFALSGSLAILVIASSPQVFFSHFIILLMFFTALTILNVSLKYTSESNNLLIVKAILYITSTTLITSSFAPVSIDQDPVLVLMLVIILFTQSIRKMFLQCEEKDQRAMDKGHLPEMRSDDVVVVLSSLSLCFIFVTAMGSWIKYHNGYPMMYAWMAICVGFICLLASSAAYACVPRPPTHVKKTKGVNIESAQFNS